MNPSVYLYKETKKGFELYLGNYSTLDGLLCLNPQDNAQITSFGASSYKEFGWATENEIPELDTIDKIIKFLKSEGEIGLIDFEVNIKNIGTLANHDDSECHFILHEKKQIFTVLKTVAPPENLNLIFNNLLKSPDFYLTFDRSGNTNKYRTFDHYLAAENT